MKILILGTTGMLGHRLMLDLKADFDIWGSVRGDTRVFPDVLPIDRTRIIEGVDALHFETVIDAFAAVKPDVVINCIGLIKQHKEAKQALPSIELNARFPHRLARLCAAVGARLIHISTDCVFSGAKGSYTEDDPTDPLDTYGKSKVLGEVTDESHAITIRTSIIGRELFTRYGLIEWFLSQEGPVKGYRKAIFSGFTTQALAGVLRDYVLPNPELHGLYHVSAEPINKYDLLQLANEAFGRQIEIKPTTAVNIDRSLDSSRFRQATGFVPVPWPEMIAIMAADTTPYNEWKN